MREPPIHGGALRARHTKSQPGLDPLTRAGLTTLLRSETSTVARHACGSPAAAASLVAKKSTRQSWGSECDREHEWR